MILYDLHTHSTHSDGELIPSESARRAKVAGYAGIALTDHADSSNLLYLLEAYARFKEVFDESADGFRIIAGVELTHVSPRSIGMLTETARNNGADIVIVHGETVAEPVAPGTNRAAIEAGADILAHPGLMDPADAREAADKGVFLEITTRRSHAYTNAHVANLAREFGASLVVNNDAHAPSDFVGPEMAAVVLKGAGLSDEEIKRTFANNTKIFEKSFKGE